MGVDDQRVELVDIGVFYQRDGVDTEQTSIPDDPLHLTGSVCVAEPVFFCVEIFRDRGTAGVDGGPAAAFYIVIEGAAGDDLAVVIVSPEIGVEKMPVFYWYQNRMIAPVAKTVASYLSIFVPVQDETVALGRLGDPRDDQAPVFISAHDSCLMEQSLCHLPAGVKDISVHLKGRDSLNEGISVDLDVSLDPLCKELQLFFRDPL